MKLVSAKCPNCNGNIEVDPTKEAGVCKYCNTAFITEKVINPTNYNIGQNNITQNFYGETQKKQTKPPLYTEEQLVKRKRIWFRIALACIVPVLLGIGLLIGSFVRKPSIDWWGEAMLMLGIIFLAIGIIVAIASIVLAIRYNRDLLLGNYKKINS